MAITKATASAAAPAVKGDLVAGSGTNSAAVLTVGSNNQVLTADSAQTTGMKWATASSGGYTLLSTTPITSVASISLTGISQSYKHLYVLVADFVPVSSGTNLVCTLYNAANAAQTVFGMNIVYAATSPLVSGNMTGDTVLNMAINIHATANSMQNVSSFHLYNYSQGFTHNYVGSGLHRALTGPNLNAGNYSGGVSGSTAITRLDFNMITGNFVAQGNIYIYGVN